MTYSIVGRDEATGCLGVAVQSGVLAVGARVPAARAGVGAVAVQAGSELTWRTALLDLMASGMDAAGAVAALRTAPGAAEAQFAAIGATGAPVVFTGPDCIPHAGHAAGAAASAQANMMASPTTWRAMLDAYTATPGGLVDRLLAALVAAEAEGGDVRGPQSAALLVVGPEVGALSTGNADDPVVDLRVDDSRDPVGDLVRLAATARAHRHLILAGMTDDETVLIAELRTAATKAPDDPTSLRAAGISLTLRGLAEEALPLLARAADLDPRVLRWARFSATKAQAEGNPHGEVLLRWLDARG